MLHRRHPADGTSRGPSMVRVVLTIALVAAVLLGVPNSPLQPDAAAAADTITTDTIDFGSLELGAVSETRSVTVALGDYAGAKPSTSNTAGLDAYDLSCETDEEVMSCTVTVSVRVGQLGVQSSFVRLHPRGDLGTILVHIPITVNGTFTPVLADVHHAGEVQIYRYTPATTVTVPLRNYQGTRFAASYTAGVASTSYACPTVDGVVTCTMTYQLRPMALGAQSGFIRIHPSGAPQHILAEFRWTMTGVGGHATLTPGPIDFGEVRVGDHATETLSLTNTGTRPLTITDIRTSYPRFTVPPETGTCPTNVPIAIGDTCTIGVRFTPTEHRVLTGALTISTDAGTFGTTINGTGVADNIALTASSATDRIAVGDELTYTLFSDTTRGPAVARTITDTIGPDFELVSAHRGYLSGPCTVTGNSFSCPIAAGAAGPFATVKVRALTPGTHTVNDALVTGDPDEVDTTDNRATLTLHVSDDEVPADLALTAGITDTDADETTVLAIVERTGTRTTTGIELSFDVPDGLEVVSARRGWFGIPCTTGTTVRCPLPDGTTSNFVIVKLRATTGDATTVDLTLTADIDADPDNNNATVEIPGTPDI